ncbi:hypothetical protein [Bacteriovorax sp. DB6_IX]|uniref:hypothetical protein n=1 Tax=Bacteriovorax sp. DB6_IX TaxID=1353530 RepID=UPI0018DF54D3|nr:hypothetical protein [Bacteriovorax sp. DB6_IX]
MKSGMTMRLQSRGLKGFLFLNSNEKDYFDHIERDYATYINLLELICLEFFNRKTEGFFSVSNLESYLEKFPHSEILSNSHLKGEEGMLGISKFVSQHMEGQVKIFVNDKTDKKSWCLGGRFH